MLDAAPVLDEQLLRLGRWIADYYLAPIGEVFRTMLPLIAEFKRAIGYRITEEARWRCISRECQDRPPARTALRRSRPPNSACSTIWLRKTAAGGDKQIREETLRSATRVSKSILTGMVRKKWLAREDVSAAATPPARSRSRC